jgi:hypothetical protein
MGKYDFLYKNRINLNQATTPASTTSVPTDITNIIDTTTGKPVKIDTGQPQEDLSFWELPSNIPSSLLNTAINVGKGLIHPEVIPQIFFGAIYNFLGKEPTSELEKSNQEVYRAFLKEIQNRYGDAESIKRTMIKDPVGFLLDLSTIIAPFKGFITSKAAEVGKAAAEAGKVGKVAETLGEAAETVKKVKGKAAETLGKIKGKASETAGEFVGKVFGTPGLVAKKAFEGSEPFVEAMRGNVSNVDLANQALEGISRLKAERAREFEEGLINRDTGVNRLDENLGKENNRILQTNIAEIQKPGVENTEIRPTQLYKMDKSGNVSTVNKKLSQYGIKGNSNFFYKTKGSILKNKESRLEIISELEPNIKNEIKNQIENQIKNEIKNQIENQYDNNILDSKVNEIFENAKEAFINNTENTVTDSNVKNVIDNINNNINQYINNLQRKRGYKRYEDLVDEIRDKYPGLNDEMIHKLARDEVRKNPDSINPFDLSETNLKGGDALKVQEILNNTVVLLKDPFTTLRDVHNLRQAINDYIYSKETSNTAKKILGEVRETIDETFKQIKIDENTTFWDKLKNYAKKSDEISEIEKLFSLQDDKNIDLAARKLIKQMRKDKEFASTLLKVLNDSTENKDLIDKLAGVHSRESFKIPSLTEGASIAYILHSLKLPVISYILAASPRLRAEFIYYLGKTARIIKKGASTKLGNIYGKAAVISGHAQKNEEEDNTQEDNTQEDNTQEDYNLRLNELNKKAFKDAPDIGTIKKGYKYKGGDPSLQKNWVKVPKKYDFLYEKYKQNKK